MSNKKMFQVVFWSNIAFTLYTCYYFYLNKHLPPPFYYDFNDTYNDFFNTNMWAFRDGRYTEWKSIYLPFNFILGLFFTDPSCISSEITQYDLRSCDRNSIVYLYMLYFFNAFLFLLCIKKFIRKIPLYLNIQILLFALLFLPNLFAVERGNYVLIALFFLFLHSLTYGFISVIFLSVAISIKQYLIILLVPYLFKLKFDFVVTSLISILMLNIISSILLGDIDSHLVLSNMNDFAGDAGVSNLPKLWNTTSVSAFVKEINYLFEHGKFVNFINKSIVNTALAINYLILLYVIFFVYILYANRSVLNVNELSFYLLSAFLVISDSPGGYSLVLLLPFVGSMLSHKNTKIFTLLLLFCLPLDFEFLNLFEYNGFSYLYDNYISANIMLGTGSFYRTIMLLAIIIFAPIHRLKGHLKYA